MIFKGYEQNLRPKLRDARGENISPKQLYFPFTFCCCCLRIQTKEN